MARGGAAWADPGVSRGAKVEGVHEPSCAIDDEAEEFQRWRAAARALRALDEPLLIEVEPGSCCAAEGFEDLPLFEDADGDVAHAFLEEAPGVAGFVERRHLRPHETEEARRRREEDEREWRRQRLANEHRSTMMRLMQARKARAEERRRQAAEGLDGEGAAREGEEPDWWLERKRGRDPSRSEENVHGEDPLIVELDPAPTVERPFRPPLEHQLFEDEDGDVANAFLEQRLGEPGFTQLRGLRLHCKRREEDRPGVPGFAECASHRSPESDEVFGRSSSSSQSRYRGTGRGSQEADLEEPTIVEMGEDDDSESAACLQLGGPLFEDSDGDVAHEFLEESSGTNGFSTVSSLRRYEGKVDASILFSKRCEDSSSAPPARQDPADNWREAHSWEAVYDRPPAAKVERWEADQESSQATPAAPEDEARSSPAPPAEADPLPGPVAAATAEDDAAQRGTSPRLAPEEADVAPTQAPQEAPPQHPAAERQEAAAEPARGADEEQTTPRETSEPSGQSQRTAAAEPAGADECEERTAPEETSEPSGQSQRTAAAEPGGADEGQEDAAQLALTGGAAEPQKAAAQKPRMVQRSYLKEKREREQAQTQQQLEERRIQRQQEERERSERAQRALLGALDANLESQMQRAVVESQQQQREQQDRDFNRAAALQQQRAASVLQDASIKATLEQRKEQKRREFEERRRRQMGLQPESTPATPATAPSPAAVAPAAPAPVPPPAAPAPAPAPAPLGAATAAAHEVAPPATAGAQPTQGLGADERGPSVTDEAKSNAAAPGGLGRHCLPAAAAGGIAGSSGHTTASATVFHMAESDDDVDDPQEGEMSPEDAWLWAPEPPRQARRSAQDDGPASVPGGDVNRSMRDDFFSTDGPDVSDGEGFSGPAKTKDASRKSSMHPRTGLRVHFDLSKSTEHFFVGSEPETEEEDYGCAEYSDEEDDWNVEGGMTLEECLREEEEERLRFEEERWWGTSDTESPGKSPDFVEAEAAEEHIPSFDAFMERLGPEDGADAPAGQDLGRPSSPGCSNLDADFARAASSSSSSSGGPSAARSAAPDVGSLWESFPITIDDDETGACPPSAPSTSASSSSAGVSASSSRPSPSTPASSFSATSSMDAPAPKPCQAAPATSSSASGASPAARGEDVEGGARAEAGGEPDTGQAEEAGAGGAEAADTWEVVGGSTTGGVLVRQGEDLSSPCAKPSRLKNGAVVRMVELVGSRLRFELLSGEGPTSGWVSTKAKERVLLVRRGEAPTTPASKRSTQRPKAEQPEEWMSSMADMMDRAEALSPPRPPPPPPPAPAAPAAADAERLNGRPAPKGPEPMEDSATLFDMSAAAPAWKEAKSRPVEKRGSFSTMAEERAPQACRERLQKQRQREFEKLHTLGFEVLEV